jgi:predicted transcriptional regulator
MYIHSITLGRQVAAARGLLNLTQIKLSKLAGVSQTAICIMENGMARPETVRRIKEALAAAGVTLVENNDAFGVVLDGERHL